MPETVTVVLTAVLASLGGAIVAGVALWLVGKSRQSSAFLQAETIRAAAEREAAERLRAADLEVKERLLTVKTEAAAEAARHRDDLAERERSLIKRQELLEQQADAVRKQSDFVEAKQRKIAEQTAQIEADREVASSLVAERREQLQKVSGLTPEEATTRLLSDLEHDLKREQGAVILAHQKKVAAECQAIAREMILTTLYRFAAAHTAEATTSIVEIPSEEMKGRIIGREGRNIRAFQNATGVDLNIDDTPGIVIVTAFDPVRREVGRLTLQKLIADGRIHTARIEELVSETQREIDDVIRRKGREAAQEVGIHDLSDRVLEMLGRLHFRTSYSQNVLRHSIEVAFITGMLAEQIGLDGRIARRAGLLHDIGKAADHDLEGGHPKIGADLLKRAGERPEIVHAALGHHDEVVTEYPYTMLVATADACSASRPGARRETLERYIQRMEELESIATAFDGVSQAFAIQAGRELRVMADAGRTSDEEAAKLARDIAQAFEERLTYPGEIKVTVIRESRFTGVAR